MKKTTYSTSIFTTLMMVFAMAFFTSCEQREDVNKSMVISGQWTGDFGMYYDYQYRGKVYTFEAYKTDLVFYPDYDYATHGYGKQVDYYDDGPYSYQYYQFEWSVKYGIIYLYYREVPELNTKISNYKMTNDYFSGQLGNSSSTFRLYKIADYYDWTPYVNDYGYGYRSGWSGGRGTRCAPADTTTSEPQEGVVIARGSKFTK